MSGLGRNGVRPRAGGSLHARRDDPAIPFALPNRKPVDSRRVPAVTLVPGVAIAAAPASARSRPPDGNPPLDFPGKGRIRSSAAPPRPRLPASVKIADLRIEYMREPLDESNVAPDPFRQFEHWFAEAVKSQLPEPDAMTLATVGAEGRPAARIVLLKEFDGRGFAFFTSHLSRKGRELALRPAAALLFFWPDLERQVRIEGAVTRLDHDESAPYFADRPRSPAPPRAGPRSAGNGEAVP